MFSNVTAHIYTNFRTPKPLQIMEKVGGTKTECWSCEIFLELGAMKHDNLLVMTYCVRRFCVHVPWRAIVWLTVYPSWTLFMHFFFPFEVVTVCLCWGIMSVNPCLPVMIVWEMHFRVVFTIFIRNCCRLINTWNI